MQGISLYSILESTAWQMDRPELFSWFHIIAALTTTALAVILARLLSKNYRTGILVIAGWILIALEVYKQLFIYYIVNNGEYNWWFFPFQLCSVPMYLCVLLPFIPEKVRNSFLTFMSTYTFVSAAAALIYPEDFLRPYITLTAHGFIWHGILLFISLLLVFSSASDLSLKGFMRATALFIILSLTAVLINAAVETLIQPGRQLFTHAYMFYLNPYQYSPQPIVNEIQHKLGIPAGLFLYTFSIICVSALTSCLENALFRKKIKVLK